MQPMYSWQWHELKHYIMENCPETWHDQLDDLVVFEAVMLGTFRKVEIY